jgi:hypothetical protein
VSFNRSFAWDALSASLFFEWGFWRVDDIAVSR